MFGSARGRKKEEEGREGKRRQGAFLLPQSSLLLPSLIPSFSRIASAIFIAGKMRCDGREGDAQTSPVSYRPSTAIPLSASHSLTSLALGLGLIVHENEAVSRHRLIGLSARAHLPLVTPRRHYDEGGGDRGREEERTLFSLTASVAAKTATRRAREKEAEEFPLPPSFERIAPRKESFLLAFGGADDHDDDMMAYFLCLADAE